MNRGGELWWLSSRVVVVYVLQIDRRAQKHPGIQSLNRWVAVVVVAVLGSQRRHQKTTKQANKSRKNRQSCRELFGLSSNGNKSVEYG